MNYVSDVATTEGKVAVDGKILKHEGAFGINGVVGAITEIMEGRDFKEGVTFVGIHTRRDPETGRQIITCYNIESVSDEVPVYEDSSE